MLQNIVGIGIDVAKAELVACKKQATGRLQLRAFNNTAAGVRQCLEWLGDPQARIVMESTGTYALLAAVMFSEAGQDVRVINPLLTKKYSTAHIRKVKTDQADAAMLAEIAERESKLPPRFVLKKEDIAIRQKVSIIAKLDQNLQSLQRALGETERSQAELGIPESAAEACLKATVAQLKKDKSALEAELQQDIIARHGQAPQDLELLTSIPGISVFLACLILQFFRRDVRNAKSWVGFVGLDISVHQSGKKRLPGRLAKRGDPYLRKRLFSAGWGAAMNDPDFRSYYDRLKKDNRHHKEATVIIARRLLSTAFAVLRSGKAFEKSQCKFLDLSL